MSGAGGHTDLVKEWMVSRNGVTTRLGTCRQVAVRAIHWAKRRIDLDWLSGKQGPHVGECRIGVGNRPKLLALMPPTTDNGLDLRHTLWRIGHEYDQPSLLPRPYPNRIYRHP
jgi:hypothetical protein